MFDDAFTKLELNEISQILDVVNKQVDGSIFDPLETTVMSVDLPFYKDYRFLNIADHATHPPLERFVIQKSETQEFTIIDWTHTTIYKINQEAPIQLDEKNVAEYVRFFFSYVKGRHGRFIVCESADNIRWKDEPDREIRKALNGKLHPLNLEEKTSEGIFKMLGFMMLKDTLFSVRISVQENGVITLSDQEILIEKIPVLDDILGH